MKSDKFIYAIPGAGIAREIDIAINQQYMINGGRNK